jgi:hypothetical protein
LLMDHLMRLKDLTCLPAAQQRHRRQGDWRMGLQPWHLSKRDATQQYGERSLAGDRADCARTGAQTAAARLRRLGRQLRQSYC